VGSGSDRYALEAGEEDEDTADDPERWLAVHGEGSREGYRGMELFITEKRKLLRQVASSRQSPCIHALYRGRCTTVEDSARQAELPMSCPWPTIPSHCSSAAHGSEASRIRWASVSRWWTRWLPARHSLGARCHRSADAMS